MIDLSCSSTRFPFTIHGTPTVGPAREARRQYQSGRDDAQPAGERGPLAREPRAAVSPSQLPRLARPHATRADQLVHKLERCINNALDELELVEVAGHRYQAAREHDGRNARDDRQTSPRIHAAL